jgi:dTDP-4-amino-4,6-dideoxygalactose transaminase
VTYLPADPLLDPASLRAARRPASGWAGLPPGAVLLESGRVALWAALRALGLRAGERLLAPAYVCDSILPAPAALGIAVEYVATDPALRLDPAGLERALAGGARAVLLVHYFGFPAPDLEAVATLCARYGAALIEDCAQALYSAPGGAPLGRRGAAAIFSPWKSLPLPDGGLLALNGPSAPDDLARLPRPPAALTARRLAYRSLGTLETALGRSPRLWLLRSWGLRRRLQSQVAQQRLRPRRASRLAEALLAGADPAAVVARRRAHYLAVEGALHGATWAQPLFEALPPGVCPLGFPLVVERREWARARLLAAGVNVRAYWEQLPTEVTAARFPAAQALADRILVLPVHQSLTPGQSRYLLAVLARLEAESWRAAS